ncbi:MAG: class I SAM-dependent methyltransferase [Gemmataceae bacterium]|nr:class I SAM-dependent methyltransferase [Gemmataceae bacterium]
MLLNLSQSAVDQFRIEWEESACPLCGGTDHAPHLEATDPLGGLRFLIVQCKRCGLAFTNPRPNLESASQFYPADYHCHQRRVRATHRRLPRYVARTLQPHGEARLLDFGCGSGGFLQRMHGLGWNVVGLDRAEAAVARVRDLGLDAHVGTLPHPLWSSECFEAITMWQTLEHVLQPLEVLRAAYRLLTPGAKLIVAVPNFDGFAARWFGPQWFGLDLPRHLTHFTPETLQRMLTKAGFGHVEMRQGRHSSWIRHSAQRGFLKSRLGSGLLGWWGYVTGGAEGLIAVAAK